ncbi:MAG: hypothetical protein M3Y87_31715 [Myxococcota bacterium]|nr:hypothetical protein [Myxococcota bacterium]
MKQHLVALTALALACASCGGGADREPSREVAGKADEAGGETLAETSRVDGATRPARPDDLSLNAFGPTPIGPLPPERADEYAIHVAIANASEDPITLGTLRLHASVYRDGLLVQGCGDASPELVEGAPDVLGPGMSMLVAQPMPCGLTEPGDYEVVSVVMVGAPPGATRMDPALRLQRSVAMPVRVDPSMPPYRMQEAPAPETP